MSDFTNGAIQRRDTEAYGPGRAATH
jgi:hypothetical protein